MLIVDDEKEIREGLAAWSWHTLGIQIAGNCSHGLEALQFIGETPVDIVLTDIRMPFMDGIELMEALKIRYPFVSVVILSGYSDFEYAQIAIRQGASDYLLKPVAFPALEQAFSRLVGALTEKKQEESRISVLRRKEQMLGQVLREDFLRRLFRFPMIPEDLERESSEGEVWLYGDSFTVASCRPDRFALQKAAVSDRELKLLAFSLDNILGDIWDAQGVGYHLVDRSTADFQLLATIDEPYDAFADALAKLEKYRGLFKSTFSIGIGHRVSDPTDIPQSAATAERTLRRNKQASSVSLYQESHFPINAPPSPNETTVPPLPHSELDAEQSGFILVQAKQYIRDNYNRSITLKDVADHVYVSQGHLSALFKDAGETYLKYLTSIRIAKAIDLLKESNIKVYEIVERVGYSDPAYFAEVFKKYTGKTPNDFRGKSGSGKPGRMHG